MTRVHSYMDKNSLLSYSKRNVDDMRLYYSIIFYKLYIYIYIHKLCDIFWHIFAYFVENNMYYRIQHIKCI